jgi:hypothetical protein
MKIRLKDDFEKNLELRRKCMKNRTEERPLKSLVDVGVI